MKEKCLINPRKIHGKSIPNAWKSKKRQFCQYISNNICSLTLCVCQEQGESFTRSVSFSSSVNVVKHYLVSFDVSPMFSIFCVCFLKDFAFYYIQSRKSFNHLFLRKSNKQFPHVPKECRNSLKGDC